MALSVDDHASAKVVAIISWEWKRIMPMDGPLPCFSEANDYVNRDPEMPLWAPPDV